MYLYVSVSKGIFDHFTMMGTITGASKIDKEAPESPDTLPPINVQVIPLDVLMEVTDNFGPKSLIGEGSYGRVYFGYIAGDRASAIKKLNENNQQEPDNEFLEQVDFHF
jgi:hypothetical protein